MAKLRKMLGKIDSPECVDLMRLIETQSAATLAAWAVSRAKECYLPTYQRECLAQGAGLSENQEKSTDSSVTCLEGVIANCEKYLAGKIKLAELKPYLKEAREVAGKVKGEIAQAAARAIATACATVQTPTNALGYLFYGAAAVAYSDIGLEAASEVYDELAKKELQRAYESLKKVSVEDEANPAKINWNC